MVALGDPAAIEALAASLDRRAEDLVGVGRRLQHRSEASTWTCAKADRFAQTMRQHRGEADRLAAEMRDMAKDLRALANRIRAELAFLGGLEARVRELISAVVPDVRPPWEGTRWNPSNLPTSGDPAWREVARAFGVHHKAR